MRIAFIGKGGSGKTTLTSLLAQTWSNTGNPVLVIDADVNQHLGATLGFTPQEIASLPKIGRNESEVQKYVLGSNPLIKTPDHIIGSTLPSFQSRFINPVSDELVEKYSIKKGNLRLIEAGSLTDGDVGNSCFHKYVGSFEVLINHTLDRDEELIVADMTAGSDTVGTMLFGIFDALYCSVLPTKRSIDAYLTYKTYADRWNVPIFPIGNMINSESDKKYTEESIQQSLVVGFLKDPHIDNYERGLTQSIEPEKLLPENQQAIKELLSHASHRPRRWDGIMNFLKKTHELNATVWANKRFGYDIQEQIDPDWSYEKQMHYRK